MVHLDRSRKSFDSTTKCTPVDLDDMTAYWVVTMSETKVSPSAEGIVVEGYLLGAFEFDSLTGHPGIRY
ncbi:hypothetical protein [Rufibacter sp. LB8]|uniref:hypothetical protein n=1 Tax=Rufibacter sp. LB8 TaxID=2777781 RepID=UPI00178C5F32|nr:hypothetical protein [Rufibacter sp. LB8]